MSETKTTFDWKKVSPTAMKDFVKLNATAEQKKSYAETVIEIKNGKKQVNATKSKKWLDENLGDKIDWTNKPKGEGKGKRTSIVDELESWL